MTIGEHRKLHGRLSKVEYEKYKEMMKTDNSVQPKKE